MKKMLGLLAFILVFLCCSALADSSQGIGATSGTCGENLTWALSENPLVKLSNCRFISISSDRPTGRQDDMRRKLK